MKCLFQITNVELYSFSFEPIDSKMYILISKNTALVIDPCINIKAFHLLKGRNITEIIVLLTHEHFDHISGVNWIKENFKCKVIAIKECANNLSNPKKNSSLYFNSLFLFSTEEMNFEPYSCKADEVFNDYMCFDWANHKIEMIRTPGHSEGSICILIDEIYVFSGDSLIKNKTVITRLPGGSKKQYMEITLPFLKSLNNKSIIFPGHGEYGFLHEFKF